MKKQKVVGFEALLRWNSHLLGQVSPADFIGMAEENGLIIDIGQWVLEQACTQTLAWHRQGFKNLSIAVNISGRQFRQSQLPEVISGVLEKQVYPQNI